MGTLINFDKVMHGVVGIGTRISSVFSRTLQPFPLADVTRVAGAAPTEISQPNLELLIGEYSTLPEFGINPTRSAPSTIGTAEFIRLASQVDSLAQFDRDVRNTFRRIARERGNENMLYDDLAGDDNIFHFFAIAHIVASTKQEDANGSFAQKFPNVDVRIVNQKYQNLEQNFITYCERKYGEAAATTARRMVTRINRTVVEGGDLLTDAELAALAAPIQIDAGAISMAASGSTAVGAFVGVSAGASAGAGVRAGAVAGPVEDRENVAISITPAATPTHSPVSQGQSSAIRLLLDDPLTSTHGV